MLTHSGVSDDDQYLKVLWCWQTNCNLSPLRVDALY